MSCRFYGYSGLGGVLMATHGNQCALVILKHAPCRREIECEPVDENCCAMVRMRAQFVEGPGSFADRAQAFIENVKMP
jgi:hypothetical protein